MPSCASLITSVTPQRLRHTRSHRNAVQKGSASESPDCHAQHVAPAVNVDAHRDRHGNRDDPATLAHLRGKSRRSRDAPSVRARWCVPFVLNQAREEGSRLSRAIDERVDDGLPRSGCADCRTARHWPMARGAGPVPAGYPGGGPPTPFPSTKRCEHRSSAAAADGCVWITRGCWPRDVSLGRRDKSVRIDRHADGTVGERRGNAIAIAFDADQAGGRDALAQARRSRQRPWAPASRQPVLLSRYRRSCQAACHAPCFSTAPGNAVPARHSMLQGSQSQAFLGATDGESPARSS